MLKYVLRWIALTITIDVRPKMFNTSTTAVPVVMHRNIRRIPDSIYSSCSVSHVAREKTNIRKTFS